MDSITLLDHKTSDYVELKFRTIKVQEVIDAVAQDGFDWLRGRWFYSTFDGKLSGGCVLGQGAINLGVFPTDSDPLGRFSPSSYVIPQFDDALPYLINQLDRFPVTRKKWLVDAPYYCGSAIVHWNDLNQNGKYILKTYKDVAKMVAEILYAHRNKTITLLTRDYSGFTAPKEVPSASSI